MSTIKLLAMALSLLMFTGGSWLVYMRSKSWTPAATQVFGLVLLVPTILVLAVTEALSKEILAVLLGGVAGYIFGRSGGGSDNGGGGQPRL